MCYYYNPTDLIPNYNEAGAELYRVMAQVASFVVAPSGASDDSITSAKADREAAINKNIQFVVKNRSGASADSNAVQALVSAMSGTHSTEPGYGTFCALCFIQMLHDASLTVQEIQQMVANQIQATAHKLATKLKKFFASLMDKHAEDHLEQYIAYALQVVAAA